MEERIQEIIQESLELHRQLHTLVPDIRRAAQIMRDCIRGGNKIMFAGNGGSAADAQHLAAELVNRFLKERSPMAGLALTTDTSIMTAIGNDYSFEDIFTKQVLALGKKGDVFFGISTSGNSRNILKAIEAAKAMGITTIGLTGKGGGIIAEKVNYLLAVPTTLTPRIQEVHILIGHILCELIESA
jgi:D-sedoheptulose 7-phosphate isomerase